MADHVAILDPVVDLGSRIGSRDWWRGLATCTALCTSAILFWPDLPTLPAAAPAPLTGAQWQEARALAIAPAGARGRHRPTHGPTAAVRPLLDTPERPSIVLTTTLGRGDGFVRVLERSGVGSDEAAAVARMVGADGAAGRYRAGHADGGHIGPPRRSVAGPPARRPRLPRTVRSRSRRHPP